MDSLATPINDLSSAAPAEDGAAAQDFDAAAPASATAIADAAALDAYSRTVIDVVERVGAAVVSVHIGRARRGAIVAAGSGSGVIVTPDGYLLTNQHVVRGAARVEIALIDGDAVEDFERDAGCSQRLDYNVAHRQRSQYRVDQHQRSARLMSSHAS